MKTHLKLLMLSLTNLVIYAEPKPTWCYTQKEPPEKDIPVSYGGHTWGYVSESVDSLSGTYMGDYQIKVFSGNCLSGTTSGGMSIAMLGDVAISDNIQITDHGFTRGDIYNVSAKTGIVGNIMMIKVTMTEVPEAEPYICSKIQIILAYKLWEFPCPEPMFDRKVGDTQVKFPYTLSVAGRTGYNIKLSVNKASPDPVWIEFQGSEGGSLMTMLSDHGFNVGEFNLQVYADYVGTLGKVKVKKGKGSQPLGIKKLEVQYSGSQTKTTFNKETAVSDVSEFVVPKPPAPPKPSSSALANAAAAVSAPPPDKTPIQIANADALKVDVKEAGKHFNGKCLSKNDYKEIKSISCNAKFMNVLSHFDYNADMDKNKFPNLQSVFFKCPPGCMTGEVIGLTIHHKESLICPAAVADRAIDHNGGVIQVFMTKAQMAYNKEFKTANGFNIGAGDNKSNVSFVIAKVDTPSMTGKNIRLINSNGDVDSKGRLEVKVDRMWSTVKKGNASIMDNVAYSACKYLGYEYGIVTSESSNVDSALVVQNKINCASKSSSFDCLLEENDAVDHSADIVVECQEKDPTNPNREDGTMETYTPYEGSNDRYPIVYYDQKKHFFCQGTFKTKEMADKYCKVKGFAKADDDSYAEIDNKFMEKTKGKGYVLLKSMPSYNSKDKKLNKEIDTIDKCSVVFLKCAGSQGEINLQATPVDQTRHMGPKPRKISCSDTMNSFPDFIRGDPGSVFTFECPEDCGSGGTLVGTGLYAYKSSICKAAVQQSLISNSESGYVSVVIGYPQIHLTAGMNSENVSSEAWPEDGASDPEALQTYSVVKTNACYLLGNVEESFIQVSSLALPYRSRNVERLRPFKSVLQHRQQLSRFSFMQGGIDKYFALWFCGSRPLFYYAPSEIEVSKLNVNEGEDRGIDLSSEVGVTNLVEPGLGQGWTVLFGFDIEEFGNADYAAIFSHSDNGCWQFIINDLKSQEKDKTFQFRKTGETGNKNTFFTKYTPIAGKRYHCALTYYNGTMKFWMNGKLIAKATSLDFNSFNCPGGLTIGNDGKSHPFAGTIYYSIWFREVMEDDCIKKFMASVNSTVLLPKGGNNPLGVLTSDGRPCITAPSQSPTPGKPGAPPEPDYNGSAKSDGDSNYANKDDSESSSGTNADDQKEIDKLKEDNPDLANKVVNEAGADAGSDKATCMMLASKFYGEKGEGLILTEPGDFSMTAQKIKCPAKCLELTDSKIVVFGSAENKDDKSPRIYTLKSSICGSAIHSGIISNEEGGDVLIHLCKGRDSFISSDQNSITTLASGATESAFYMNNSPMAIVYSCDGLASDKLKPEAGAKYNIACPANCYTQFKNKEQYVYGCKELGYTFGSSVCLAAMHAGKLSNRAKADVSIEVFNEDKDYPCNPSPDVNCKNNGIESKGMKGKVGFRFVDTATSCKFYEERMTGLPMYIKYDTIKGASEFNQRQFKSGMLIRTDASNSDETIIVNSRFECGNANLLFNLALKDFGKTSDGYVGVVFRYLKVSGEEEYYLLKIMKTKAELMKVVNGSEDSICQIEYNFGLIDKNNPGLYRVKLLYNMEKIDISLQKDPSLEHVLLCKVDNDDIKRGSIGIAKKGHVNADFTYFAVKDVYIHYEKERYNIEVDLKKLQFGTMESFCPNKYKLLNDSKSTQVCLTDLGYCKLNCSSLSFYMRLQYKCILDCLDKYQMYLAIKEANANKKPQFPCKDLFEGVDFAAMTKVDYMPQNKCDGTKNDGQYYPAYVSTAKPLGELCQFHIKYVCDKDGKYELIEIDETQRDHYEPCGAKIEGRKVKPPKTENNPTQKNDCELKIVEPQVMNQDFLKHV